MTKAQEKAIERLRKMAESHAKTCGEVVQEFEVEEFPYCFVSVFIRIGLENEGVLGFLARDYAHFFVGERGGVRFPVRAKDGHQYCLPFKWATILQAVCKQRGRYFSE